MRRTITALAVLAAFFLSAPAGAQSVQPPDRVFLYQASAEPGYIVLDWDVVPGHYLYRERFGFSTATPGIELGEAEYPAGRMHEDEFFGRQEIYRDDFRIRIPFRGQAGEIDLEMQLQGCADIGLCYPPQRWPATVQLASAAPGAAQTGGGGGFSGGGGLGGFVDRLLGGGRGAQQQVLPPDEAFGYEAAFTGPNELTVRWRVTRGYYLYRDRLGARVVDGPISLGTPDMPEGVRQVDEFFGESYVFFNDFEFTVPFSRSSPEGGPVTLELAFQGCADIGFCYPPLERELTLTLAAAGTEVAGLGGTASGGGGAGGGSAPAGPISEQDRLAGLITDASLPLVLATFFGLGLLLAFTPCVLPMVPILSSLIAGQAAGGRHVTASRAFTLSLAFVLGMAVTYTVAGAIAAMAGAQVQAFFQHPAILGTFAAVFVLLALGMFGFYNLQMPSGVQSRIAHVSNRMPGGTYVGATTMGALSALIVTACVAPPLVAALAVIGHAGDVFRGSSSLFAMSLGMGVPLLLVGASAGKLLPKAGPWMYAIKNLFGLLLLVVAVWMLERVVPGPVALALWAGLAFLAAVYLGALEPLGSEPAPSRRLAKGAGAMAAAYGLILLVGAATGGHDPLRPLSAFTAGGTAAVQAQALGFQRIKTVADLESEVARAAAEGRPVMLDFTADWCVSCKEMERRTFPDPQVQAALAGAVLLQADVTAHDAEDQELMRHFGIFGPPTIAFFDRSGQELPGYRLVGFINAERFARHVGQALQQEG